MPFDPTTAKPVSKGFDPTTAKPVGRFPVQTNASIGPIPEGTSIPSGASEAAEQASGIESQIPGFQRFTMNARQHAPLLLGGTAAIATGGASLPVSSLLGGAGTGAGELVRQRAAGEELDPVGAAKEGGKAAAFGMIGGGALKALGWLAGKLFRTPLDAGGQQAAQFAREQGLPFPLSSAKPGSGASVTQQGTRGFLAGDIRNHSDATKVAQFLNRNVNGHGGALAPNASPVDEAATKGQQFLRTVFEPGETVYKKTMGSFYKAVGSENAPIPTTATKSAVQRALASLEARGETAGKAYERLKKVADSGADSLTAKQLDELMGGLSKDVRTQTNATAEARKVREAIIADMDDVGQGYGVNFAEDMAALDKTRREYERLRGIPSLEKLSKEFQGRGGTKGTKDWMARLFQNPDGRALAEIRKVNPDLYHELADSWLAANLNKFSRTTDGVLGRTLDGPALRTWFEQNRKGLTSVFNAEQIRALDNFTVYAQYMSRAGRMADDASRALGPKEMLARGAGEFAAAQYGSPLILMGEPAAYLLAKGLADPGSVVFKAFTQGFSPATRSFMVKAAQIGGQASGTESR